MWRRRWRWVPDIWDVGWLRYLWEDRIVVVSNEIISAVAIQLNGFMTVDPCTLDEVLHRCSHNDGVNIHWDGLGIPTCENP